MGSNVEKYVRQQPIIADGKPYGPEPRRVALVVSKQSGRFPIYEDEYKRWDKTVQDLSKKYDVPAELIHSMLVQESEYGRSKKAGNNVLQMTKPAYAEINDEYARKKYGWTDSPQNSLQLQTPEQGAEAGVRYLVVMRDRYGVDLNNAYKAGRRFNGSKMRDSYGRNIENMVSQFGDYRQANAAPPSAVVVEEPVPGMVGPMNRPPAPMSMNNIRVVQPQKEVMAPIQIDWV